MSRVLCKHSWLSGQKANGILLSLPILLYLISLASIQGFIGHFTSNKQSDIKNYEMKQNYRKVASTNLSCLEEHSICRLF